MVTEVTTPARFWCVKRARLERGGLAALPPVGVVFFGLLRLFLFLRLVVVDVVVERVVAVAARFGIRVRVVFAVAGFGAADAGGERGREDRADRLQRGGVFVGEGRARVAEEDHARERFAE